MRAETDLIEHCALRPGSAVPAPCGTWPIRRRISLSSLWTVYVRWYGPHPQDPMWPPHHQSGSRAASLRHNLTSLGTYTQNRVVTQPDSSRFWPFLREWQRPGIATVRKTSESANQLKLETLLKR